MRPQDGESSEELIWWGDRGWVQPVRLQSLITFEDAVYREFPSTPPPRSMVLHAFSPPDHLNDDDENTVEMLAWLPWPRVIGERLVGLIDTIYLGPSVQAHIYYAPAYMLHSLYMRSIEHQEVFEIFLPPGDLATLDAFSGLRGTPDGADPKYFSLYMERNAEFRAGFGEAQCAVIRQFLQIMVPWQYLGPHVARRDAVKDSVRAALTRLLAYWT